MLQHTLMSTKICDENIQCSPRNFAKQISISLLALCKIKTSQCSKKNNALDRKNNHETKSTPAKTCFAIMLEAKIQHAQCSKSLEVHGVEELDVDGDLLHKTSSTHHESTTHTKNLTANGFPQRRASFR